MVSLALWGLLWSYYSRIGAFCDGCMTNLWHIVWFRRDWYRPAEDDTSCYLVDRFEPGFLLL